MAEFDDLLPKVEDETPKQETEKVDDKVEAKTVDDKVEEKTDEKVEEKVEENTFSFDSFKSYAKETYEKDIESPDDLKAYFEKADKVESLDSTIAEKEQKITELTALASKGLAGRDWFANDDEFIRQQFLTKKSGEFSESALTVLSDLSPDKVKKLDAVKAIEINMMVDNPDLSKDEVKALLEREYGMEDGMEEMDTASKAKLKVDGNASRKSLGKLYDGIEVPKAVNFEEQLTAKREAWNTPVKEIVEGIDKLQITEDFAFDIKSEDKAGMTDSLLQYALATQSDVSEATAGQLAGMARSTLLEKNLDKIMKAYGDNEREKAREEWRKEVHNDKDLNNDKRSAKTSGEAMSGKEFMDSI